jgi:hypothetical protein
MSADDEFSVDSMKDQLKALKAKQYPGEEGQ